jgi:tripartite-type tricarboxylate transporter receptor subunit TctC
MLAHARDLTRRRRALVRFATTVAAPLAALACASAAWAQSAPYPNRPVTLIVPFAVGSSTDIMTRVVAKVLNDRLKTSHFIVDNKPGANGVIASDFVAKSKPDGYTLLVGTGTTHTQAPWMMKTFPYDPVKDFEPVAGIGGVPLAVLVGKDSPFRTMEELRRTVAATPGRHAYGTAFGMATVCSENIRRGFNLDLAQVPYKSSPQALTDLIGGRISMLCTDFNSSMAAIRGGQVRALAVTTSQRNAQLPDVPTMAEMMPGFPEMRSWVGVFAPRGTPPEITQMLAPHILAATESADAVKALGPNGFERLTVSGASMTAFVQAELAKWGKLIEAAGIQKE